MIPFEYRHAADPADAVAAVSANHRAAYLGGGTNLVDHMKLGVADPEVLIDVSGVLSADIEPTASGGLRIGAAVRNSDLTAHPDIRQQYPALARALLAGASGQIRNAATTGGNLLQRTRCPYFQDVTTPCNKREPGSGCSAIGGYTRSHAILGASEHCIAVHPSDMAVALTALDAVVVVLGRDGERQMPLTEFYRLPGETPQHDTVLEHGDLILAVELPGVPAPRSTYVKVRDRASYAFALTSVAAALELRDGVITEARIALGGVAHKPWRAIRAEEVLRGARPGERVFTDAADAELADAQTQPGNAFKVAMTRNAVASVLRRLCGEADR